MNPTHCGVTSCPPTVTTPLVPRNLTPHCDIVSARYPHFPRVLEPGRGMHFPQILSTLYSQYVLLSAIGSLYIRKPNPSDYYPASEVDICDHGRRRQSRGYALRRCGNIPDFTRSGTSTAAGRAIRRGCESFGARCRFLLDQKSFNLHSRTSGFVARPTRSFLLSSYGSTSFRFSTNQYSDMVRYSAYRLILVSPGTNIHSSGRLRP